ncbi:transposase [Candidatus Hydrogenedentota bacterium]
MRKCLNPCPRRAQTAPRIASIFGGRRDRYESAQSVCELTGTVPVTRKSGKTIHVVFRRACRKSFRNTMRQFAFCSLRSSVWARAYYDHARDKGQSNATALRNLAIRWLKIIYRMWMDGTEYNEQQYLKALCRRKSPLASRLNLTLSMNKS